MGYEFEWDPIKTATNLRDHGVSFEEASSVFADPLAMLMADPDHSTLPMRSGTCCWGSPPSVTFLLSRSLSKTASCARVVASNEQDNANSHRTDCLTDCRIINAASLGYHAERQEVPDA